MYARCTRRGRERREKRRRNRKGNEGVPSYNISVQGHTKRGREGFPAITKASRDTQARKKREEKKGERERERARESGKRERGGKKRKGTGLPSYEQASRDTGRGVYLSVAFRNTSKSKIGREGR